MKIVAWLYALVGTGYFGLYIAGFEIVERFAQGPLWLMMVMAPVVFGMLIAWPLIVRFVGGRG